MCRRLIPVLPVVSHLAHCHLCWHAAAYVVNNSANNMLALSAAGINFVAGNLSAEVG
jgi:hypothetical protein